MLLHKNKISPSPFIKIKDILKSFYYIRNYHKKYYQKIYKSDYCVSFSRSTYSLYKIYQFLNNTDKSIRNIFIPDYICNESLSLLRNTNAELIFYDHTLINSSKLIIEMKKKKADIFICVSYFGESINLNKRFLKFLKNSRIISIEDNTHCLFNFSNNNLDIELYSPYKLFGIADGSIIKFREKLIYQKFIIFTRINKSSIISYYIVGNFYLVFFLLKKSIRNIFGYKYEKINFEFKYQSKKYIRKYISPLSNYLLNIYSDRILEYKSIRLKNYYFWKQKLEQFIPFLNIKRLNYIPYLGLIKFENKLERVNILKLYNKFGLPITNWPDLPPEVFKSKLNFKTAKHKFRSQITIPVHQDINKSQIEYCMRKCFSQYINSFQLFYFRKNNKIKIFFSKQFIGYITILHNTYTNQNILRLKFNNKFYNTYNRSERFFYMISAEFINKLKIKKKIHLPIKLKDISSQEYFVLNGIKDNIIPLSLNSKTICDFVFSFLRILNYRKIENNFIRSNLNINISSQFLNNENIDLLEFKLGLKLFSSAKIVKNIDHVILLSLSIFDNKISLDQYLIYLCEYYKNQNFNYLKINKKFIDTV